MLYDINIRNKIATLQGENYRKYYHFKSLFDIIGFFFTIWDVAINNMYCKMIYVILLWLNWFYLINKFLKS